MNSVSNIFQSLPDHLPEEVFEDIAKTDAIRIERILSHGHSSPESGWYDQTENEWVMVLQGCGTLEFENGETLVLRQGDHLTIPAHKKHRVASTTKDEITIWLAVFY